MVASRESSERRWADPRAFLVLPAACLLVIAMPVVIGWLLHLPSWVSFLDGDSPPMMFNAALLFVACACSLVLFLFGQRGAAYLLGIFVAVMGLVVLIEYGIGQSLGIDQLFVEDWRKIQTPFPGRMAFSTAYCFVFSGMGLLVLAIEPDRPQRYALLGAAGALLLAVAILALFGHWVRLPSAYTWAGFTAVGMAWKTALSFTLLGAGFVGFAWAGSRSTSDLPGPFWLPLGVGIALFAGAIVVWQALLQTQKEHGEALAGANAQHLVREISTGIDDRMRAVERMARRVSLLGANAKAGWMVDAKRYVEDFPAIVVIEWQDGKGRVRGRIPGDAGDTEGEPWKGDRVTRVRVRREHGKPVLVIDAPVTPADGFIRAVFDLQTVLSRVLDSDIAPGYAVALYSGGQQIFHSGLATSAWSVQRDMDASGLPVHIKIAPTAELLRHDRSRLPETVLALGAVLALVVSLLVRFGQLANLRAHLLGRSNVELERSERKYRQLMEQAADGIFVSGPQGNYVDVNERACTMSGYTREELLRLCVLDLIDPQDLAERPPLDINRLSYGDTVTIERRMRRKDGTLIPVETNVSITVDGFLLALVRDVSERRRSEALNLRLGRMLDGVVTEIYALDAETLAVVQANRGALKALGYSAGELANLGLAGFQPEITPERFLRLAAPLLSGEQEQAVYETLQRRKNGTPYRVEARVQWLSEEVPPVFIVTAQDITERRQAEAEMRKLSRAVEQTDDPVMITNAGGIIEYVNPAFERVTGYPSEEVLGRTPNMLRSGQQDDEFYAHLWSTILGGQTFRDVLVNRRNDGALYYEEKTITPLKDERGAITHFVSTGKDITEHLHVQERLRYLAQHDALTQLPNRVLFLERLSRAIGRLGDSGRRLAVVYLDLDRFGSVNKTAGYRAGDRVLQLVAERLRNALRQQDTVARMGDDQFALIVEGLGKGTQTMNDFIMVAQKLLISLAQPYAVHEREIFLTASVGLAVFPDDAEDGLTVKRFAEAAMERAKEQGGNRFHCYEAEMNREAVARIDLRDSLHRALERRELMLHYQPAIGLQSGRVDGVEAMLRWKHPGRGVVAAGEFLPLLEETGLIVPVGAWVLRAACEQAAAWHGTGLPMLPVALNVSTRQLAELDYARIVGLVLEETRLDPRYLQLDLDEEALRQAGTRVADTCDALHRLGVTLALNDFDVGRSSLGLLKQYPIDTMKVRAPETEEDGALLGAIVSIAHRLGLRVVAGRVESKQQLRMLSGCACDSAQGNAISEPLAPIEMARWLQKGVVAVVKPD